MWHVQAPLQRPSGCRTLLPTGAGPLLTGSSDVSVAIFVSSSREYVYASDTENGKSSYAVVKNSDSGSGLVLLKEIYPKIESVAIVCKGGDNAAVQAKLIKLVSAATGLTSNRISIAGSK